MKQSNDPLHHTTLPANLAPREEMHRPQPSRARCRLGGIVLAIALLSTSSAVAAAPVRFAVFGDCGEQVNGGPELEQKSVADLVDSWLVDFVVTTGDNIYFTTTGQPTVDWDGAQGQYYGKYIRYPAGSASAFAGLNTGLNRFFLTVGNHDWDYDGNDSLAGFSAYFELPGIGIPRGTVPTVPATLERYYDFIQGDVHFFVIDSDVREPNGNSVAGVQAAWLQAALAASTARWRVVTMHHPPFSSGAGPSPVLQWPFQQWGADLVLDGHAHVYERIRKPAAPGFSVLFPYFTSGLGGRNLQGFSTVDPNSEARYNADFGALLVSATDATATIQFFNSARNTTTSALVDSLILQKEGTAGIVERRVASGLDDAEESATGTVDNSSSDLEMTFDTVSTGDQLVGIRFPSVAVSPKATVRRAYIQFQKHSTQAGGDLPISLRIQGEESLNPADFKTTSPASPKISARTRTTQEAVWTPPTWSVNSEQSWPERTVDISAVIQEVINQPGWANNNSIVLILSKQGGSVNAFRRASSFNGAASGAPLLHIEWEQPNISVVATDPSAAEAGADTGTFTIKRPGDNATQSLDVNFSLGGTATAGSDFTVGGVGVTFNLGTLQGTVTIPQNAASAAVLITPIDDTEHELIETVVLTVTSGPGYNLGTPGMATVNITSETVIDLGVIGTDTKSYGFSVSDSGRSAGSSWRAGTYARAFRTSPDSPISGSADDLNVYLEYAFFCSGASTVYDAASLNPAGLRVVGDFYCISGGSSAPRPFYRYEGPTGSETLALPLPQNGLSGSARSIDFASPVENGLIVGYAQVYGYPSTTRFCYWAFYGYPASPVVYDMGAIYFPGQNSYGADSSGSRAVGYRNTPSLGINKAFLADLSNANLSDLVGPANATPSEAYAINSNSDVVGFYESGGVRRGALWHYTGAPGIYQAAALNPPAGFTHSIARNLDQAGTVVGHCYNGTNPAETDPRACLWTGGGSAVTLLGDLINDNSWTLHIAYKINNTGKIVGYGTHNGQIHGFLIIP